MRKFELQQLRAKAFKEARNYFEQAEKENRDMNADEKAAFQKCMDDVASLDSRVTALEQIESTEVVEPVDESNSRSNRIAIETRSINDRSSLYATKEYKNAWLRAKILGDFEGAEKELRTINTTVGTGGYAITPTQLVTDVVQLVQNYCWVDKFAQKYHATSPTARIPLLSTNVANAVYGATEVTATTADTTSAFTARDLTPRVFSKLIKCSILSLSLSNLEEIVKQQIARSFAYGGEDKWLNGAGSGSNEPLGLFTASASGISTGRDVDTGSSTSITGDSLFAAKYKIKQQYLADPSTCWIFHRDSMKIIATLKDSQNRYLLSQGLDGNPDKLLGYPILLSEYAPNTFTSGLYVGLLGPLNQYAIASTQDVEVVRLTELYAATHEVGIMARTYQDGMPVLEEAFARLKTS